MIPEGKEICKKQLFNMITRMEKVEVHDEQISEFLPEIFNKLDWMSKEDLIRNFVSVEFNRFLNYYKDAPDLNVGQENIGKKIEYTESRKAGLQRRPKPAAYSRFYINIGSKSDMDPTKLIGLLLDTTNDRSIRIGKIDIMKGFSFFEVDKSQEQLILRSFNKNVRRNRQLIKVELSDQTDGSRQERNFQDPNRYGSQKLYSSIGKKRKKRNQGVSGSNQKSG
jgi:ATP-dependent RNA helicase DeaD